MTFAVVLCFCALRPATGSLALPPIHQAAADGNLDEVMRLVAQDPALRDKRDEEGNAPLHHAAWNGRGPVAEYLLKAGSPVDIRLIAPGKTLDGATPLFNAAVTGQTEMVRLLLRNGADVNARDAEGNIALHHAVWHNQVEAAQALLDAGANVNARRKGNVFPLETAAYFGYEDMTRLLIARGALVNLKVYEGYTPLHQAAREGRFGTILILVEAGGDIAARTDDGRTPLHVAAENGRENETRLLLAMGSDPNAATRDGLTPLTLAKQKGQSGTARILAEHLAALSETQGLIAARNAANKTVRTAGITQKTVYQNTFNKETVGPEWGTTQTGAFFAPLRTSPIPGRTKRFLGDFGDQDVRLTLAHLPPHTQITVILNLHIINSWDGNRSDDNNGPDLWEARVLEGPTLFRTTFANASANSRRTPIQAFPAEWPLEANPGRTGAVANDVLNLPDRPIDAVYRLKFVFAHNRDNLVLIFGGKNLRSLTDESWGIGEIEVRAGTVATAKTLH